MHWESEKVRLPSLAHARRLQHLLKQRQRINRHIILKHFIVQMRTGRSTGIADGGDFLAEHDPITTFYDVLTQVAVGRNVTIFVQNPDNDVTFYPLLKPSSHPASAP